MGALVVSEDEIDVEAVKKQLKEAKHYNDEEFMDTVSTKQEQEFGDGKGSVVVVDTGAKNAILRNIRSLGYKVIKVPWNTSIEKILSLKLNVDWIDLGFNIRQVLQLIY